MPILYFLIPLNCRVDSAKWQNSCAFLRPCIYPYRVVFILILRSIAIDTTRLRLIPGTVQGSRCFVGVLTIMFVICSVLRRILVNGRTRHSRCVCAVLYICSRTVDQYGYGSVYLIDGTRCY
ncbi:unnamed protein product [Laminaria digitata]